jgi:rhodanese-related sulfurtransferase
VHIFTHFKEDRQVRYAKLLLIASIPIALLAGCGQQTAPAAKTSVAVIPPGQTISTPFETLQQLSDKYLKAGKPLLIEPQEVFQKAVATSDPSYYLVDIRSDEHYANHHIPGAVHISYADAWRGNKIEYLPRGKKIVVIDYSGHSSSQIASLWSLLGYDAVAMKHGMAGWSKNKDVIGGSPIPCEPKNLATVKEAPARTVHELPKLDTKSTTETDLILKRAEAVAAKPVVIQADDLLTRINAKKVFVLDIRDAVHYQAGHIATAVNVPLKTLLEAENLKQLPADQQIVVVCYDGHASSQAARLLNQLGYDTLALRDGMSVWTGDSNVIGAKTVACDVPERMTAKLNAPLSPGPSTAAT